MRWCLKGSEKNNIQSLSTTGFLLTRMNDRWSEVKWSEVIIGQRVQAHGPSFWLYPHCLSAFCETELVVLRLGYSHTYGNWKLGYDMWWHGNYVKAMDRIFFNWLCFDKISTVSYVSFVLLVRSINKYDWILDTHTKPPMLDTQHASKIHWSRVVYLHQVRMHAY
jgi:hypothetical protein